jgi:REP element-mobilizing transposase RayT
MPDHLHALVAFSQTTSMKQFITSWKSYHAKQSDLVWQRDFFDHWIRGWESLEAKADYIRQNPVRAKLVEHSCDWHWYLEPDIPAA